MKKTEPIGYIVSRLFLSLISLTVLSSGYDKTCLPHLSSANCCYIDTSGSKSSGGDKTGRIAAEFLGASVGQAGLGLGLPYLIVKSSVSGEDVGTTIESSITFLILYAIGAPIGSTVGCITTGKLLSEPGKSFGSVVRGALIGEAIGWGAQLLMAYIGKESLIFFFIPVSVGAVVAYNRNNRAVDNMKNYNYNNNINKYIGWNKLSDNYYPQKIDMKLFTIKF